MQQRRRQMFWEEHKVTAGETMTGIQLKSLPTSSQHDVAELVRVWLVSFANETKVSRLRLQRSVWQLAIVGCVMCSLAINVAAAADIVVGMSAAFKGPSRGLSIELYRGSLAYFDHVNAAGGIHGKRIVIRAYDDGYDPIPAI